MLFLANHLFLYHFLCAWNEANQPCVEERHYGSSHADEQEFGESTHPQTIAQILYAEHQGQVEDVGSIALLGEPLHHGVLLVGILAEDPKQSEADKDAHERLIETEPLPHEFVPWEGATQIVVEGKEETDCQCRCPLSCCSSYQASRSDRQEYRARTSSHTEDSGQARGPEPIAKSSDPEDLLP